jgi:propionyl-CoA synthetase
MVNRGLSDFSMVAGRDHHYEALEHAISRCSGALRVGGLYTPSYTLYTSGTTGKPKGVQRDTGGYTVALAASMKHIFMGSPGRPISCTSDIGWVVGHSYIVYGPLIAGMATILYEGLPIRPDGGVWWQLVEKYKVTFDVQCANCHSGPEKARSQ